MITKSGVSKTHQGRGGQREIEAQVRMARRLDRTLQARRTNGEFRSEAILLAIVALVVVALVFDPVLSVVRSLAEPVWEVAALW